MLDLMSHIKRRLGKTFGGTMIEAMPRIDRLTQFVVQLFASSGLDKGGSLVLSCSLELLRSQEQWWTLTLRILFM